MKTDIFYYFTRNIKTKEEKMFTFDSYQGDIDEYIKYDDELYIILDYTWEFFDLETEIAMEVI